MKKLIVCLAVIVIILSCSACNKENNKDAPPLRDIFSSLSELVSPSVSDMVVGSIAPGNGPIITFLKYKNDTLIQSSKLSIKVVSSNFAFGLEGYFEVIFAHKTNIDKVDFSQLLNLQGDITASQMDLRNFIVKIDKDQLNVYLRAEKWTANDIESSLAGKNFTGQMVYFQYSLITDELFDEFGQKINL